MAKTHYSVARVGQINKAGVGKFQRHNERQNKTYKNMNVNKSMSHLNIHFKDTGGLTYNEKFDQMEKEGLISTRGLKPDAKVYDELLLDVNTTYFEENGGYEFAKKFYSDAYEYAKSFYGEQKIIAAVMHADELNVAVTEELGRPVYHYHLHVIAIPTVEKEIKWSKRCRDPEKIGQVKEVITQVSHSKKWKSLPKLDENGEPIRSKNGKVIYEKSYSRLQDDFFDHMKKAGYTDFVRGEKGSTEEHLEVLDFKIKKDTERLKEIEKNLELSAQYGEKAGELKEKLDDISDIGKKTLTGKVQLTQDEFESLHYLAEKGIAAQKQLLDKENVIAEKDRTIASQSWTISDLRGTVKKLEVKLEQVKEEFESFKETVKDYVAGMKLYPEKVKGFFDELKEQYKKEQRERKLIRSRKEQDLER